MAALLVCRAAWWVPLTDAQTAQKKNDAEKKPAAKMQAADKPNIFKRIAGDQVAIWTLPNTIFGLRSRSAASTNRAAVGE